MIKTFVIYVLYLEIFVNGNEDCKKLFRESFYLSSNTAIQECQIVTINLEELEKKNFRLSIVSNDIVIDSLNFYKTDGFLADGRTPIWLTNVVTLRKMFGGRGYDQRTYRTVDKYPFLETSIQEYVPEIGDFRFYQNLQRSGSMVVFFRDRMIILEGNIGNYVLRHIPSEKDDEELDYIFVKLFLPDKQKNEPSPLPDISLLSYNLLVSNLKIVNFKMLLILHPSSIDNKPRNELMRSLLMYYNHLDMFFGNFTAPQIKFTIKGIIIPDINHPISYKGNNELDLELMKANHLDRDMKTFLKHVKHFFNLESHDNIFLLHQSYISEHIGYTYQFSRVCERHKFPRFYVIFHGDFQTYHIFHLQYLAAIFGADFNSRDEDCVEIIHQEARNVNPAPLIWSSCSVDEFFKYFSKTDCDHYNKNKPVDLTDIRDPKDDRLRMSIRLSLVKKYQIGVSLNVTSRQSGKKVVCSCTS